MRLLIVSQYFWPENFRINDLAVGMRDRGHEVTVLTGWPNYPDGDVFPDFRKDPASFGSYEGIEVVRVPVIPRGSSAIMLALNYLSFALIAAVLGPWRLRKHRFDSIFVFQTSPITAAIPALLLGRLKRAKVLMWVLDLWPDTLAAIGVIRSRKVLGLVGWMVRLIYAGCDMILVQSRGFIANVARHGAGAEKVRYFPNWIEPTFAGPNTEAPPPELAAFRNTFNIMFAGNIGEAQDMPSVLAAAEKVRDLEDVRWLIVGDGRAMEGLRADIERRGLGDRVFTLGRHPVERMPAFFSAASAMLVSLKAEPIWSLTIPGKVQSYLAAGKPVIAMLDGEGARVVLESGGGLVAPAGDADALALKVREMVALTEAQRQAVSARGRAYARAEFDRDTLFEALERFASEVNSGQARRSGGRSI